jgi:hypothetical protein
MCEGGACVEDPCNRTHCPEGDTCHRGVCSSGEPTMEPVEPTGGTEDVVIDAVSTQPPEGCACEQRRGPSSLPLWLVLWLPLMLMTRRARQRASSAL